MSSTASILGFRDVLKNPNVKRLWIAQIVSIFGDFLAIFAVFSVVTFQLHGTPTQVSMILAAYLAPLAVISPLAGVFVDKWNVKATSFGALLSVYVRDVLQSNAALFGTLNSLIGFGMIAGTQSIRRFAMRISPQHMVIYGLAGMGAAVFVTALFGMLWSTVLGMLGLGFFAAFIIVTSQTLLQQETPQDMLGRVSSSLMSLMAVSQVLAMFVAGPVAQKAGLRNLYFGSSVMLLAICITGLLWLRKPSARAAAA